MYNANACKLRNADSMAPRRLQVREDVAEAEIPLWKEALFGAELLLLYASPVYYGLGVPHGDGSAVVLIPGFLGTDIYLGHLYSWLGRIGYRPYFSKIGLNAECPNILIERKINQVMKKAVRETRRKVHIIGHSLGGIMARSIAAQSPQAVASVITLAAPFRGTVVHKAVLKAAESVRRRILAERGNQVLPECYTGRCTCNFLNSLRKQCHSSVMETAIYTKNDGVVDWQYCITGDRKIDFEVPGTHIGLAFNTTVYNLIAKRLAMAQTGD